MLITKWSKPMMTGRKYWKEISLIFGLIILYRDSLFARFFQDDFILKNIALTRGLLEPIANFPYRPIAIQLFYNLSDTPVFLHMFLFFTFLAGLFYIFKITKSYTTVLLYAFNISLFPLFYWVATSYFSILFLEIFLGAYLYLKNRNKPALLVFVAALLTNELAIVFPALLVLLDFLYKNLNLKKIFPFIFLSLCYLPFRLLISPFPQVDDYKLDFSLKFFATARWYALRIFNLPEGIRNNPLIIILFALLIVLVLLNIKRLNLKLLAFSVIWFFVGALPFFFLPNHMSAYYLTISLFGPMVFLAEIVKKFKPVFLTIYIILSFLGLEFLKTSHWIILKP